MFVIHISIPREVLSQSLRAMQRWVTRDIILFILFNAASLQPVMETISLEKKNINGKKKNREIADRLSRASRAVDLRGAGSDKSATAETAVTSRKIEEEGKGKRMCERTKRRKEIEKTRKRVAAVAHDLSRLSRFFIRRLCLAGFVSQVIRDRISLSLLASHGGSFSVMRDGVESFRGYRTWCRRVEQSAPITKASCCEHRFLAKIFDSTLLRFINIKYWILDIKTWN